MYFIVAIVFGSGLHFGGIHFIAEHYQVQEEVAFEKDPTKCQDTYSYYGPFNYMLFNGGYHIEHHDFPLIPYRKLPLLTELAPEFYKDLPHHTSYIKLLFNFIFRYPGLYQRVKRKKQED